MFCKPMYGFQLYIVLIVTIYSFKLCKKNAFYSINKAKSEKESSISICWQMPLSLQSIATIIH